MWNLNFSYVKVLQLQRHCLKKIMTNWINFFCLLTAPETDPAEKVRSVQRRTFYNRKDEHPELRQTDQSATSRDPRCTRCATTSGTRRTRSCGPPSANSRTPLVWKGCPSPMVWQKRHPDQCWKVNYFEYIFSHCFLNTQSTTIHM